MTGPWRVNFSADLLCGRALHRILSSTTRIASKPPS